MLRSAYIVFALVGLYSCSIVLSDGSKNCDPKTCTGPVYYYQELGCIPIYENSSSCCPIRYNCDHWKNLPETKCFVNGKVYESGEMLSIEEFGSACSRCLCAGGTSPPACVGPSCMGPKAGCYLRLTPFECCSTREVCPEKEEDIPTCVVDGKTYKDGEPFTPMEEPEKNCYCGEGYTGENVEPFCISHKPGMCGNALFRVDEIRQNCAPVYDHDRSPQRHCNIDFRCYDAETDSAMQVQPGNGDQPSSLSESCIFGNATVRIGGKLAPPGDGKRSMECVCEVPPALTCRYLA